MRDGTTLLFDLPGFRVIECVENEAGAGRTVTVITESDLHACPARGVIADHPFDHREMVIKDLPFGPRRLELIWRKRRYRCREPRCPRRVFTEVSDQIPPRHRLTARLRAKLESSASGSTRALSDVAAEYRVSWRTVNDALVRKAAALLPEPAPATMIGIDETRTRSVRWVFGEAGWKRTDPWMTSFVDLDLGRPGGLIGLAPGRSGASVTSWLRAQPQAWRAGIEVVAIDPSAPFAGAIRRELPGAVIVVDHWHLVRLANQMLAEVRQRAAREQLGPRGGKANPAWAHRQLLLRAGDQLSSAALDRLEHVLGHDDPTSEIGAAWAVKELLRQPLAARDRHTAAHRLHRFYSAVLAADMPETTRLALTVDHWWPHILAFLNTGITNARNRGLQPGDQQIKRVSCGHRNQDNYQRRIVLHNAAKRAA